jgi:hypothetical protein
MLTNIRKPCNSKTTQLKIGKGLEESPSKEDIQVER